MGVLREGQNINFAVPASLIRELIDSPRSNHSNDGQIAIQEVETLRAQQRQVSFSDDPTSESQQLEGKIRQLWQSALDHAGASVPLLEQIATGSQYENISVMVCCTSRKGVDRTTATEQEIER